MARIPINIATGSLQKEDMIVGIDLGTTNSLIAIIHPESKKSIVLKEEDRSTMVPSVIYFRNEDDVVVGEEAKPYLISDPAKTIFSAKRLMGKSYSDLENYKDLFSYTIIDDNSDGLVKVKVGNTFYNPVELSAEILKKLKQRAEHILKVPVSKAVITVPAYFNDAQRQATRDAGKLAGLDVLRIINEPTAASLAYGIGLNKEEEKTVAVYDLGGGTFDISILRIHDGVFDVLSTHGNTFLGGDDFDRAIVAHWAQKYNLTNLDDAANTQALRLLAEEAKKELSGSNEFKKQFNGQVVEISIEEFNAAIKPYLDQTIDACKLAVKDSGLAIKEIDEVVLVGGSTRVPAVKNAVEKLFGKAPNDNLNPDEVVALGAAIQADVLAGNNKDVLLLDITPLSLGVEMAGNLMDVLIPRNSKVPNNASRQYTTQVDGQGSMRIAIFQGERDIVTDNRKLAEFNLKGIPGMPAGMPKVEIKFVIDADGILKVSAKELRSGVEQSIEVKPQYGITDEDVERMLKDSIDHAEDDIKLRALTEARTEGEQLLKSTEKFVAKHAKLLTPEELSATAEAMQALQLAVTMDDKNLIQSKTEELNTISRPYAERIMDEAVSAAMKGKGIST